MTYSAGFEVFNKVCVFRPKDRIEAVMFTDTPECLSAISDITCEDIAVDHTDKDNPILKLKFKNVCTGEQHASVGDFVCFEDGQARILSKEFFLRHYEFVKVYNIDDEDE